MIGRFLNGRYGLAVTFWVGVLLGGIVLRVIESRFGSAFLHVSGEDALARLRAWHLAYMIAVVLYFALIFRAVILAARGRWLWGGLASVVAFGALAAASFTTLQTVFPQIPKPRALLQLEIAVFNRRLPVQQGEKTVLERVMLERNDLVVLYRINGPLSPERKVAYQNVLAPGQPLTQILCGEFESHFRGGIRAMRVVFTYDNDIAEARLTGAECLQELSENP